MHLSIIQKENQNKRTKVNSNQNFICNSPSPILPISFSTLLIILVFINTPVYCQKKDQAKPIRLNAIERQKSSNQTDQVKTIETKDKTAVSTSHTQGNSQTINNSPPSNFDINSVSADVRQKLEENKKKNRPFFEGISLALEFEVMDAKIPESELVERIQKNTEVKTPIQIKKKEENRYWIITDTNTSISLIKEIVSAAGLTVNFISKSYRLK